MILWHSIPLFSILLPLLGAALASVLPRKAAHVFTGLVLTAELVMSSLFLYRMTVSGESFTYSMGHYPAPWGNEIRAGLLEAIAAFFFMSVMLLSYLGGLRRMNDHVQEKRHGLICAMLLLMTTALNAQVYTNDIFTAYVFLEIMTLSAVPLIASRKGGLPLLSASRYMIMNMIGSSLFLLGVILLYDITGHLLMSPIRESVRLLEETDAYQTPLTVVVALITVGLGIKSALFPFHTWVPSAYSNATPVGASIMASLVSKAYIFLLMKIIYRVIGFDVFASTGINAVLFTLGLAGMLVGSLHAIRQTDLRYMVAFSSVAQLGYIYMGMGLGTAYGMTAALFHVFAHAICKSMLFLSADGLVSTSPGASIRDMRGAGFRAPLTAAAFTVGALSMVGFPFLGGFASKVNFALAAVELTDPRRYLTLAFLVISTWLNTLYFLSTVVLIYQKREDVQYTPLHRGRAYVFSLIFLIASNIALGIFSQPLINALMLGLTQFG